MLALSPASPPADGTQGPPFAEWTEHKPILRSTTTEAVRRIVPLDASAGRELVDQLLHRCVVHWARRVGQPCGRDDWEKVFVGEEFPFQQTLLQEVHPGTHVSLRVDFWSRRLTVELVFMP